MCPQGRSDRFEPPSKSTYVDISRLRTPFPFIFRQIDPGQLSGGCVNGLEPPVSSLLMSTACTNQELLAQLVSFDTTSDRPTQPLFDFICTYLDVPGVRTERFDCGDGYENVWFETGPSCKSGEGIVLCGHVDTVPAEEPDWESDPRELVERDGRLHARGACD